MITFKWSILETFGNEQTIEKVRYFLKADDGKNSVETEGEHIYLDGSVNKSFSEIKEEDLTRWLEQDTTKNEVNIIKLNLEKQLEELKTSKKVAFPWEADTFIIG